MKKPNYLLRPLRPFLRRTHRPPPGTSPGYLRPREGATPPRVTVLAYGPHEMTEHTVDDLQTIATMRGKWPVLWVNVDGVDHVETVRALGTIFQLHRLALEDVVNVPQRPKVEPYEDFLFIVARMTRSEAGLETEQIGIFLGRDFVLTFQERSGDPLEPVRDRIRGRIGRIRGAGPDYLAYAVLDAIVDHYFPVLEHYADRLDVLEEEILGKPDQGTMTRLYEVKRDLASLRRTVWPQRDALNTLVRDPSPLIEDETRVHIRDCYDHLVQSMELVESFRDLTASLTDLYLSIVGQRTNEIMKVLTVFAAIFIPLTFIAGVYGMNFENMPELHWAWGYPAALALMTTVGAGLWVYFRRKGWVGGDGRDTGRR